MSTVKPPIPYLLAYAHTLASRRVAERLRRFGLTARQFGVLVQLQLEPELTMSELARQFGVSRQSLHEMVGELEDAGHLRRVPGATGRTVRLVLTEGTERLLAAAEGPMMLAERDLVGGLNARETEALRGLLQKLLARATDDESWLRY
ncbi:hypothetical protein A4R43_30875 [Amycolatopsis albispora]|uniref:HTH marR-type domain-containing protein n=1 Tax=Amycolatopsis albispora TaxID=1804986 RepID=A0A344LE46_9PSEU|nr:hypothetical protein A4R43_30875 [Amycolatopsis albispora]